jgi:hypothetical protein
MTFGHGPARSETPGSSDTSAASTMKKAQYLSGEPRVEFLNLQVAKGTPAADALRP